MKIGLKYQRNSLAEMEYKIIFVDSEKEIYHYVREHGFFYFDYCILDNGSEQILNEVMEELKLGGMIK